MSSDMPDWLSELLPATESQEEAPLLETGPAETEAVPLRAEAKAARRFEPPEPPPARADVRADSRGQGATPQARRAVSSKKPRRQQGIGGLLPWQTFFLSVLLFLDVAVIGLLFLVMLGRVVFP